jgi:hypothetical protein
VTSGRRRFEDTAGGCRSLAEDDRARATLAINLHMRASLERSAEAWTARARLLDRLEANFDDRVAANAQSVVSPQ